MQVRPKKVMAVRKFVNDQPPAAVPSSSYTFPAPIRGWVLNENLATAQPAAARRLDNWLCTTTGVRARGGAVKHATLPDEVTSLFTYVSGTEQFFGATDAGIFTITAPTSATAVLTSTVSGLTSGDFTAAQFGTAGGNFLYAVNGSDLAHYYDGTNFYPVNTATVNNLPYAYPSAPWMVGQTVTGASSGASATIVGITQTSAVTGTLRLGAITGGPFTSGEDITSATSSLAIGRNKIIRSQELDNAAWTATRTSVSANATTAPDGTTTAEKVIETATTGTHFIRETVTGLTANTTHTFTAYVKAAERTNGLIRMESGADEVAGNFQLGAGTITASTGGAGAGAVASIEALPNDWWRIRISGIVNPSTTSYDCTLTLRDATNTASYTGDGTSGLFYWGAQLEVGSAPTPYEKTAGAARTNMVAVATAASSTGSTVTITGPTTSTFSHVWSFANRLFFVQKNTLTAWYLPVDSLGGTANSFSLAGVFKRGGSLLFGATWSQDSGAGLDDKCVFVSTEGDVAVYAGTNPGSAADWALQGVYTMPKPLGKNAHTQAGGDLLIATEVGLIPISAVLQTDLAALDGRAVSAQIAPYWQQMARTIADGWNIVKAPRRGVIFISQPDPAGGEKTALAVNSLTGAWSRCTGWDTRCLGYFNDQPYFGAGDNCVYVMDTSGSDAGSPYTAIYLGQHESLGLFGKVKSMRQMRATFQSGSPINPYLSAQEDFREEIGTAPSSVADYTVDEWDSGLWDTAIWDADTIVQNDANWTAVGVTGYTIAPELQLTFGVTPTPFVELVSIDAEFHVGAGVA